jgi:hypothetical protein
MYETYSKLPSRRTLALQQNIAIDKIIPGFTILTSKSKDPNNKTNKKKKN